MRLPDRLQVLLVLALAIQLPVGARHHVDGVEDVKIALQKASERRMAAWRAEQKRERVRECLEVLRYPDDECQRREQQHEAW